MRMAQSMRVLDELNGAALDFLVEKTPTGWRVETEQRGPRGGHSCEGADLTDTLAQLAQVLMCEREEREGGAAAPPSDGVAWLHDAPDDVDTVRVTVEAPVEFCRVFEEQQHELEAMPIGNGDSDLLWTVMKAAL